MKEIYLHYRSNCYYNFNFISCYFLYLVWIFLWNWLILHQCIVSNLLLRFRLIFYCQAIKGSRECWLMYRFESLEVTLWCFWRDWQSIVLIFLIGCCWGCCRTKAYRQIFMYVKAWLRTTRTHQTYPIANPPTILPLKLFFSNS